MRHPTCGCWHVLLSPVGQGSRFPPVSLLRVEAMDLGHLGCTMVTVFCDYLGNLCKMANLLCFHFVNSERGMVLYTELF